MIEPYTVIMEQGEDGYIIGSVVEFTGCRTQAKTKKELMKRMAEAVTLFQEEEAPMTKFLGIHQLQVPA